jgi:hypothetical protein
MYIYILIKSFLKLPLIPNFMCYFGTENNKKMHSVNKTVLFNTFWIWNFPFSFKKRICNLKVPSQRIVKLQSWGQVPIGTTYLQVHKRGGLYRPPLSKKRNFLIPQSNSQINTVTWASSPRDSAQGQGFIYWLVLIGSFLKWLQCIYCCKGITDSCLGKCRQIDVCGLTKYY